MAAADPADGAAQVAMLRDVLTHMYRFDTTPYATWIPVEGRLVRESETPSTTESGSRHGR